MTAVKVKPSTTKKSFTSEEKAAWKEERLAEQKQLLEDAHSALLSSEAWTDWVKFGRPNLNRLSFSNALLIWSQRRDATTVWGRKQWSKLGAEINEDAQALRYLAPCPYIVKKNGKVVLDANGQPEKRVFYKIVYGYDIKDTDSPAVDFDPMVELEGDDLGEQFLAKLEGFARSLGLMVFYRPTQGGTQGYFDQVNSEIVINDSLSGNSKVRVLIHELAHAYGNVNYTDYSREEAEVLVESATVMTLGILGYDVRDASVPYIASWGNGDLKVIEKYAKLVDELVKRLTKEMGV